MNELDLPPRRTMPPEVRDHIRGTTLELEKPPPWTVRQRAPLVVAAGVAVLVAGAVVVGQSVTGTPDDFQPGAAPPSSTQPPVTVPSSDARTSEDLDHCGVVAHASPRAHEFTPRADWTPVFTVVKDHVRLIAFREGSGKPAFCKVDGITATVSDPNAEPMALATSGAGTAPADIHALYLSSNGLLAGVAQGVASLEYGITHIDGSQATVPMPTLQDDLFVMDISELKPDSTLEVTGLDDTGATVASGEWVFDPAEVPPVGASGAF
jgi:hypothetical protein